MISSESLLPDDPSTHYSRIVSFAPGDGETVDLNPPRFRWYYHPKLAAETVPHIYRFRFQIARDAAFGDLILDTETPYSFSLIILCELSKGGVAKVLPKRLEHREIQRKSGPSKSNCIQHSS